MGQSLSTIFGDGIKPITVEVRFAPTAQHEYALRQCARIASSFWNSTWPTHVLMKFADPREFSHSSRLSESWQPHARIGKELFTIASEKHISDSRLAIDTDPFEILIRFNPSHKWYAGSDKKVPADHYDLTTTCLREMVHGLFMYSDGIRATNSHESAYFFGPSRNALTERFISFVAIETKNGDCALSSYKHAPKELYRAVVSDKMYFRTEKHRIVRLHAPRMWDPESSVIRFHSSEGGNILMKPKVQAGEAIHEIDDKVLEVMKVILDKDSERPRVCGRGEEYKPPPLHRPIDLPLIIFPIALIFSFVVILVFKARRRRIVRHSEALLENQDLIEDEIVESE